MRTSPKWMPALGAASMVAACAGNSAREDESGSGIPTITNGMSTDGDTEGNATMGNATMGNDDNGTMGGATQGMADDTAGTPLDTKFDLGVIPDTNYEFEEGCTKVDFLFVIDNSGSMADEQANLVNSFPGFISGIQSSLEQVDEYQVGVVTTDAYSYNQAAPGCNVLGGLVVQTGGSNSSNSVCGPYAAGNNFMTEADNLDTAFACAARVGTQGSGYELTMNAMENVLNKIHGGPGGCNEGYLRDDALLVVVIITDEYDGPGDPEGSASSGDPTSWYDTVVAAKLGIPENAVALGLINYAGGPCPPSSTVYDGANIANFVSMFGANGFLGGVCEADYGPIFSDAVGIIEDACNNFTPPG